MFDVVQQFLIEVSLLFIKIKYHYIYCLILLTFFFSNYLTINIIEMITITI